MESSHRLFVSTKFFLTLVILTTVLIAMEWIFNLNFFITPMPLSSVFCFIILVIAFVLRSCSLNRFSWKNMVISEKISDFLALSIVLFVFLIFLDNFANTEWKIGHFMSPLTAGIFFIFSISFLKTKSPVISHPMSIFMATIHALIVLLCLINIVSSIYTPTLFYELSLPSIPFTTSMAFIFLWMAFFIQYENDIWPINLIIIKDSIRTTLIMASFIGFLVNDTFHFLTNYALFFTNHSSLIFLFIFTVIIFICIGCIFLSKKVWEKIDNNIQTLKENEERWRRQLDGVGDGGWDWNIQTGTIIASSRMKSIIGFEDNDDVVLASDWVKHIHPEDVPIMMEALQAYWKGENSQYKIEYRLKQADDTWKWTLSRGVLISRTLNNKPLRMLGTLIDISDKKLLELKLAKNLELLNTVGTLAKIGGWEVTFNPSHNSWTDEIFHILEIDTEEIHSTRNMANTTELMNFLAPEFRVMGHSALRRAITFGTSYDLEAKILTSKNNLRWVRIMGKVNSENGQVKSISGIMQDISHRKHAEEALQQSEIKLAGVLEILPVGVWLLNAKGDITFENQAGHKIWSGISPSQNQILSKPTVWNDSRALLNGQTIIEEEIDIKCFDGTHKSILHSALPLRDCNHNVLGAVIVNYDLTLRKIAEDRLREAKTLSDSVAHAKSNFLSNMSHEIRTPMNAIIGMAELLSETELDSTQTKYVEIFQKSGLNLLHIIDDILDISKIESGKLKIEKNHFNLKNLIEDTVEILGNKAESKKLLLTSYLATSTPEHLWGDDFRIKQILTNLIGNSIKFTHQGSISIKIGTNVDTMKKGNLYFDITDTGIGIKEEHLHKLFRAYSQADSSTTKAYGGTGLGLTISKKLVEMMGGEIWITSQENVGTKICFTLTCEEMKH